MKSGADFPQYIQDIKERGEKGEIGEIWKYHFIWKNENLRTSQEIEIRENRIRNAKRINF